MTNVVSKTLIANYLVELAKDEAIIAEAAEVYEAAEARLNVGLRRYIALRDYVTEQLGKSPYARDVSWPGDEGKDFLWDVPNRGRYRFTGMSVGDAVLQVLEEKSELDLEHPWMSLAAIIEKLSEGGLGFPAPVQARTVNAALLKTTGVGRATMKSTGEVVYRFAPIKFEPPSDEDGGVDAPDLPLEPEDIPFE